MILSLHVPDPVYALYEERAGSPSAARAEMATQLTKFKDFAPNERVVVLSSELRERLERMFGAPIEDGALFVEWLEKQLSVQIGGVMVPLSEGQRKRIATWAEKAGQTPAQALKDAALRVAVTACGGA